MTDDRIKASLTPQGHVILSEDAKSTIERRFEEGDKRSLFEMFFWCTALRLPVPDWAARAINKAYWQFDSGGLKSWEAVFGKPFPGKSRKKAFTDSHALAVQMEVHRIVWREECAIDEDLFGKGRKEPRDWRTFHRQQALLRLLQNQPGHTALEKQEERRSKKVGNSKLVTSKNHHPLFGYTDHII